MQITIEWLKSHGACYSGIIWFIEQGITDVDKLILKLRLEQKNSWAQWLEVKTRGTPAYPQAQEYSETQKARLWDNSSISNRTNKGDGRI